MIFPIGIQPGLLKMRPEVAVTTTTNITTKKLARKIQRLDAMDWRMRWKHKLLHAAFDNLPRVQRSRAVPRKGCRHALIASMIAGMKANSYFEGHARISSSHCGMQ